MPDYFTLLRDRVTLKCRSLDRLFFQAYVPKLQSVAKRQLEKAHLDYEALDNGFRSCPDPAAL